MQREYDAPSKADEYLQIADAIPYRGAGESVLLERLPDAPLRILDMGCGDGRLMALVLDARQGSGGVAVDVSPPMLERARARFAGYPDVQVIDLDVEEDTTNILLDVTTQLTWLRELGFVDVDCDWKWLELALLAGVKPTTAGAPSEDKRC